MDIEYNPQTLFCLHMFHSDINDMTAVHTCLGMYLRHKVGIVFDLEVFRNMNKKRVINKKYIKYSKSNNNNMRYYCVEQRSLLPSLSMYVPGGHSLHMSMFFAPVVVLNVPVGHG